MPNHILCVDDEALNLHILTEILQDDFTLTLVNSGEECMQVLDSERPDLIIMDVMMPTGMDGFETTRKIREKYDSAEVPVIFVSADETTESKLKSYSVGGDDYITKPFNDEELVARIESTLKWKKSIEQAHEKVIKNQVSSHELMKNLGEISVVIHFLQATFSCNNYDVLAKKLIQSLGSLGLNVAVQIILDNEKLNFFSHDEEGSPLEDSVFNYIRTKGRLIDFGQRTAVNYPNISFIIRNMPTDDKDLHGRIRDHIAIIGQGADSKINTLKSEFLLQNQKNSLNQIFGKIQTITNRIENTQQEQTASSKTVFEYVAQTFEEAFLNLGLSGEQEDYLRNVLEDTENKIQSIFQNSASFCDELGVIIDEVKTALDQIAISAPEPQQTEDDGLEDTVVLF